VYRRSLNNTTSLQYFTDLGNRGGNEVSLTIQRTTDEVEPVEDWPQVEAVLISPSQSVTATRPVRAGAQFFAQASDLAQTAVRLANKLTYARGRSTWTLGLHGAWHDIRQTYLPGAKGDWLFRSVADLAENAPQRYQRTVLLDGLDPEIAFNVVEAGAFVQDQLDLGRGLTLRFGLRADVPFVTDSPRENTRILSFFGRSTANVPSGMFLISPRLGFNWQ
jgi:hypothetical protein